MNFKEEYYEVINALSKKFADYVSEHSTEVLIIEIGEHTTTCELHNNKFSLRNKDWRLYNIYLSESWYWWVQPSEHIWEFKDILSFPKDVIRHIKMEQARNDLFFEFNWIKWKVSFTGYNDSDWWAKYKPNSIKEWDITWYIDRHKERAIYKWLN